MDTEFIIGNKYLISFTEEKYPNEDPDVYFEGIGILIDLSPTYYAEGVFEFWLPEVNQKGYFSKNEIVKELKETFNV